MKKSMKTKIVIEENRIWALLLLYISLREVVSVVVRVLGKVELDSSNLIMFINAFNNKTVLLANFVVYISIISFLIFSTYIEFTRGKKLAHDEFISKTLSLWFFVWVLLFIFGGEIKLVILAFKAALGILIFKHIYSAKYKDYVEGMDEKELDLQNAVKKKGTSIIVVLLLLAVFVFNDYKSFNKYKEKNTQLNATSTVTTDK